MSITSTITNISSPHKPSSSSSSTQRISNGAQACAACKYQRRKCAPDCILAPYFPHDKQAQFLNAHKLFGVSNITKIIRDMKQREKDLAMETIIFQSNMRARDPVGGCFGIVRALHYQIACVTNELEFVIQQIAACRAHQAGVYKNEPVMQEFNDHQNYQIMPMQYDQEYVNQHHQQQQQQQQQQPEMNQGLKLHENEDDVSGSEVLNHHPPPQENAVQEFQYSWGLQDESPLEGGHDLGLEEEVEAFQQHQIPEHDLRSAATLFTLTS